MYSEIIVLIVHWHLLCILVNSTLFTQTYLACI